MMIAVRLLRNGLAHDRPDVEADRMGIATETMQIGIHGVRAIILMDRQFGGLEYMIVGVQGISQ